jgi:hypothetical protein
MSIAELRGSGTRCPVAATVSVALLLATIAPVPALAGAQEDITKIWTEVGAFRYQGEFDRAIGILDDVIERYSDSEQVLRHAYNELIYTYWFMNDRTRFEREARVAVERFPDLEAPPPVFPPQMNDLYGRLREEMYGALEINTKPEESRLFLNGDYAGTTPFTRPYLKAGRYEISLSKTGYDEYADVLAIEPNQKLVREIALNKQKDTGWWLWRIGAVATAGTILAIALINNDGGGDTPQPLPGPPAPPTR